MLHLWELAIKAKNDGIDLDKIIYRQSESFSPYMELSFNDLNETEILDVVEINPFYRYYDIFKDLLVPDINENTEIISEVFDLVVRHLIDIDLYMGMNKREYYIKFIISDIKTGYFGAHIQRFIEVFNKEEQSIIANSLLSLYSTGEEVNLLKEAVKRIFKGAYILSNSEERNEVVFFLRTKKTSEKEEKIALLQYLFLPFKYTCEIYWERIFGILDVPELMIQDEMVLY